MSQNSARQKPIRTAIVGLSANAVTSWAASAHLPSLLSDHGRERFVITALLNSSEEAARAAIQEYNFDKDTVKAYGSAKDLAQDSNVDLVIVNTRVDRHFESAIEAIKADKDVFVEWPVAANLGDMEKLAEAAKKSACSRVVVGLQGRWVPPVLQLRNMLRSGQYGKLLSCDLRAYGGTLDRAILPTGLKYFAQKEVGGNPITIGFGHVIDYVQSIVGDLEPESTNVRTQIQRPTVPLRDPVSKEIVDEIESNVPDLVSAHGRLEKSQFVVDDATLTAFFRRGQPFPGSPSLTLSLVCDGAEIVLISPSGINLQADAYDPMPTIQVHDYASDTVSNVPWMWDDVQMGVPRRARGVQRTLYAFADGDADGWVDIHDALRRAKQIDSWLRTP